MRFARVRWDQEDLLILQGSVNSSDRDKAIVILHLIQTQRFMFVRDYSLEEGTQTQTFPPAIKSIDAFPDKFERRDLREKIEILVMGSFLGLSLNKA